MSGHPRDDGERNGAENDGGKNEMAEGVGEGSLLPDSAESISMKPVTCGK